MLGALACSICYDRYVNPEYCFFDEGYRLSKGWADRLNQTHHHKYVIFGGSSVKTSIIPSLLLKNYGLPVVNAGGHAGFGAPVLTELALDFINEGDTLIIALEPGFLSYHEGGLDTATMPSTWSGDKFLFKEKGIPYQGVFRSLDFNDLPELSKGSSYHNWTMIAKLLTGTQIYRYRKDENLVPDGWMSVYEHRTMPDIERKSVVNPVPQRLTRAGINYLLKIKSWAEKRNVKLFYSLPRAYEHENARYEIIPFLLDVMNYVPVLRDPVLGVLPDKDLYADTINHPTPAGAELTTKELGRELKGNDLWTKDELESILKEGTREFRFSSPHH